MGDAPCKEQQGIANDRPGDNWESWEIKKIRKALEQIKKESLVEFLIFNPKYLNIPPLLLVELLFCGKDKRIRTCDLVLPKYPQDWGYNWDLCCNGTFREINVACFGLEVLI